MVNEILYVEDFQYLLDNARTKHVRAICPLCHERRTNKKNKSLSIKVDDLAYHCHYCDAKGYLKSKMNDLLDKRQRKYKPKKMEYKKPQPRDKATETNFSDSFLAYFNGRGISKETLIEARVTQDVLEYQGKKKGYIGFNFYLEDELINIKRRTRDKHFTLEAGAKLIPYNINSISPDAYDDNEPKMGIIVEGEIDALTYIECGFKHVVSVPNGANSNIETINEFVDSHFDKLETIYISVDSDKKGIECRNELVRRFGAEMCKLVEYPKPCKDINEVLVQYGREKVAECIANAKDLTIEGVQELIDVESSLDDIFENGFQKGTTVGVEEIDKILSFKTGMLNIVTGIPSHGKTFLLNYLLVRLNLIHDWKIAFFSPEFYPVSDHIAQVMETFGGARFNSHNYTRGAYDQMKSYLSRCFFWIDPDDTDVNSVMDRARYLIRKKGIKALVIDPFNSLTDKERKWQKQDEYISEFLQKLRWFARKYNIAVFIVMHPTKQVKQENGLYPVCDLYSCKGASEIFDKADIGLTVWRNELDEYAELHVTKIKFRHLGEKGHTAFKFNKNNGRYVSIGDADELKKSGIDIKTMNVEWDNRNYILDKLRGEQQFLIPSTSIQPNEDFLTQTDDVPF